MADSLISGRPIGAGYPYRARINVDLDTAEAAFPVGSRLAMGFRDFVGFGSTQLAMATTENGRLIRIDDDTIELALTGADTVAMDGKVVADIVRTDLSPDEWTGYRLTIPVEAVATRTGGDA